MRDANIDLTTATKQMNAAVDSDAGTPLSQALVNLQNKTDGSSSTIQQRQAICKQILVCCNKHFLMVTQLLVIHLYL